MKKWTARLLALALCFVLVWGEGGVVSAAETVGDSIEVAFEEYGGPYIGAQYLIQKPGTYTGTFRFKDGNTIKLKHKFTFRR